VISYLSPTTSLHNSLVFQLKPLFHLF